jgi:hypothetical protein
LKNGEEEKAFKALNMKNDIAYWLNDEFQDER